MSMTRRHWIVGTVGALSLIGGSAVAQDYPNKPMRLIVPAAAGNTSDATARFMAQKMAEKLGQQVVVDNRPGGNGSIGVNYGIRSAPDGYTLTVVVNTNTVAAMHTIKNLPYNPLQDLAPVASFFEIPTIILGGPNYGPDSLAAFIADAKARPGRVNYATYHATGVVAAASLKLATGTDIVAVPYKSGPQALTELLAGEVQVMLTDMGFALPQVKAGKVKPYAVTSAQRSPLLPEVPTLRELLPNPLEFRGWAGFAAPLGTPAPVVARLNAVINEILATAEAAGFLRNLGAEPVISTPEQFAAFMRSEEPKWGQAFKAAGIEPE